MSENKQRNGARNLKTIAPLCSLCPSRVSTSLNVSQRLSTSLNVSQRLSTSLNVSQRLSTSPNVSQRLSTSLNVSQRLSTSLNVSQRLSTSLNVSQRLSTSLNVSRLFKRVPARRKGLDGGSCIGWSSLGIFDKLDRPNPGNDLMDSQFLATISAHILDIVHVLYINYIYVYVYIYIQYIYIYTCQYISVLSSPHIVTTSSYPARFQHCWMWPPD